jgi:uncharacterized protein (DUF2132 family)/L-amino acid N-acyltransferase YncA
MATSDPLHGVTLQTLLTFLVERIGWEGLAERVPIRCFQNNPSMASSLRFLRNTPWARARVEKVYAQEVRHAERKRARNQRRAARRRFANLPLERPDTLAMLWPADAEDPVIEVPDGYVVQVGLDLERFSQVQRAIDFEPTPDHLASVEAELFPGGMVFVEHEGQPVGVAVALQRPEKWVELSWLAVDPAHRGKGLGGLLISRLITTIRADHQHAMLSTTDDRLYALSLYVDLGFHPVERPEKYDRWAAVYEALGLPGVDDDTLA